jgi:hypothetical protein
MEIRPCSQIATRNSIVEVTHLQQLLDCCFPRPWQSNVAVWNVQRHKWRPSGSIPFLPTQNRIVLAIYKLTARLTK